MTIKKLGKRFIYFILLLPIFLFSNIEFTQKVSKESAFINETIKVTLLLKIDDYHNIEQVFFEDYETEDFWITKHEDKIVKKEEGFTTYKYSFLIDAKAVGQFKLPKQLIEISNNEIRNYRRWQKVYSNEEIININPLVENLSIQGDYKLKTSVNKTSINENDSVKLKIELTGSGNLKDIKPFEFKLPKQIVYDDKPILIQEFIDNKYKGSFTQEFLIISNDSFTIKPFEFTYFNIDKKRIEKIKSEPIFVEVKKTSKANLDEYWLKYIFLIIGLITGVIAVLVYIKYKELKRINQKPLAIKIRDSKNDKELYKVLVAYSNSYEFDEVIKKLEENIYAEGKNKIKKRDLLKYVINK